jgi:predicted transcriptional regulator
VLALLGYQRYADDDPLEHDLRATLYDRIREEPGIYLSALAERSDAPMGTVRYHLRVLEFEGMVVTDRRNGKRRYVPLGVEPDALDAVMHEDAPRAVLEALFEGGPASTSELAERLDRDPSTVTHHVQRLEESALVERERDGRAVVTRLDGDARAALARRLMDIDTEAVEAETGTAPATTGD